MWTFERYQRWMDQMSDWVRPAPDTASYNSAESRASLRAPAPAPASAGGSARLAAPRPQRAPPPVDDIIEVPAEDMDLAQIAELAKKVVDRKPK